MDTAKKHLEIIPRQEATSNEAIKQYKRLLQVLIELKIIEGNQSPELNLKSASAETSGENATEKKMLQMPQMLALPPTKETAIEEAKNPVLLEEVPEKNEEENICETLEVNEDERWEIIEELLLNSEVEIKEDLVTGDEETENIAEIAEAAPEIEEEKSKNLAEIAEAAPEIEDPFRRLQNILVEPQVSPVRELVDYVDEKVANLEHQIYGPGELINLILPYIAEILSRKVDESKEEVIGAIAPIIDQIIESKTEQDRAAMSGVLAPLISAAISQQIRNYPEEVASAIAPTMGKAIKEQITLERDSMVDALYPVIGSTISKYMAEAIRDINEKVSNTLSTEGVARKMRAKIQGVSEAELILQESIPYTVQAVFLIHKASGLIISEAQQSGEQRLEADMIGGMLTAIRSFANECVTSGEGSELGAIDYGSSQIVLEVAGYCYLAVVVKGEPPKSFIKKMRRTLETIVLKYGKSIEFFDGDSDTVPAPVKPLLETLLCETSSKQTKAKPPVALIGIILASLGILIIPWGIYSYRNGVNRRMEAKTVEALGSAPELAVYRLNAKADGETLRLSGKLPTEYLRQKAEKIARDAAPGVKLYNQIVAVEVPADPVLTAAEVKRVTSILNQTNGMAIASQYNAGRITLSGTVNAFTDAKKITQAFAQIPGVKSVTNTVELQPFKIGSHIYFERGSTELNFPDVGDKINQVKALLGKHPELNLKIIGHSDRSGTMPENQRLSLARAKTVRDTLIRGGIAPERLLIAGTAKPPLDIDPVQDPALSRVVRFEAIATKN